MRKTKLKEKEPLISEMNESVDTAAQMQTTPATVEPAIADADVEGATPTESAYVQSEEALAYERWFDEYSKYIAGKEPTYVDSIDSSLFGVEQGSVLREMHKAHVRMVLFYTERAGGTLSIEDAVKQATRLFAAPATDEQIKKITKQSVRTLDWHDLNRVCARSPKDAEVLWDLMKREAQQEVESGHRAAEVFEPVDWMRDAWNRARFLAIRESFIEQWQPQGGIDLAMIDMLVQSFYLYLYWTEQTVKRTQTEMRAEPSIWVEERARRDRNFPRDREEMEGFWDPPSVNMQQAVEHVSLMAERYAKAFQRNLRAMRDLRRYSPQVTIQNNGGQVNIGEQVNVASDGGQQVNIKSD